MLEMVETHSSPWSPLRSFFDWSVLSNYQTPVLGKYIYFQTSTSHNSRSETLGHILTSPIESDNTSDSLGPVRMGPSVSKVELRDVICRVTENILNLDTSFMLNTAEAVSVHSSAEPIFSLLLYIFIFY